MMYEHAARRPRTYLNIEFDKTDHAKRHGAKWDIQRKSWYVVGGVPAELVNYIAPDSLHDSNLRFGANLVSRPEKPTKSTLRRPPPGDEQADFFVPTLYDVATKDSRSIMDVAVFRLSKKDKRIGETIRYDLTDGYVEVKAGPDGMASVWDYDIVLMAISHLTEAMNRYHNGRGEKPGLTFRPHVSEILKFCRRSDGGRQYEEIEGALDRLKNTTIKIVRTTRKGRGRRLMREAQAEGLIGNYKTVSYADTGRVAMVEVEIPGWIYREVVETENPEVLTVHPAFFLIEPGIGRFLYRVARRAAGKGEARWAFRTIYERSGSAGTFKEFCRILRGIIAVNDLPEYDFSEVPGKEGPILVMTYRNAVPSIQSVQAIGG